MTMSILIKMKFTSTLPFLCEFSLLSLVTTLPEKQKSDDGERSRFKLSGILQFILRSRVDCSGVNLLLGIRACSNKGVWPATLLLR